ncbi:YxD-tail cyclophane-containing RiPP peptide [Streptomyces sp. NPDC051572]|uniref:YxD-tail cyclophane-containing RiPP peptide n=1 Tax=unclassified Streptomyces TaxID=2593676 RepID=UPI00344B1883
MADLARYDVAEYGVAELTRHDVEEPGVADPAAVRYEPGGTEGHADGDRGPLPDYTGVDLTALRAQVDHPVLGAVLATLLARSCSADGGLVAYHEDSPGAER